MRLSRLLTLALCIGALGSDMANSTSQGAASPTISGVLSPYTLFVKHTAARTGKPDVLARNDNFHVPPSLLGLANRGHLQNITIEGESISLVADTTGTQNLIQEGFVLSRAQPSPGRLVPAAGTINGIVRSTDGGLVGGATITAVMNDIVLSTTSASNGTYSLAVAVAGDYRVSVYAPGYEWQPSVLVAVANNTSDVSYLLVPQNLTIRGIVSDGTSTPIQGVEVYASSLIWDNITAGDSTLTDASGRYTLTVSADTYDVRAFAPPLGTLSRRVAVGANVSNVNFGFKRPRLYMVEGVLRKSNGQPLPAAEITFFPTLVPFDTCDSWYSQAATVGSDGRYKVELPQGLYDVDVQWPSEWGDHWVINTTGQTNVTNNTYSNDFTLPAVGTIRGKVLDPNDRNLANATVFSWRDDPNASPYFDGFFQTDNAGNYIVTATLGVHNLVAFSPDYVSSTPSQVNLTGSSAGVNMSVRTAPVQASGKVGGSDGAGLGRSRIGYQSGPDNARYNRRATVYYNGLWRAALDPGSYDLSVTQPYYHEQDVTVNVAPGDPVFNFNLTRKTYVLTGRVTSTPVGWGVCDAYMTASDASSGDSSNGGTTGDGYYAMLVAPGTLNVFPYKHDSNSSTFNTMITVPPAPAPVNFLLTQVSQQGIGALMGDFLNNAIGSAATTAFTK